MGIPFAGPTQCINNPRLPILTSFAKFTTGAGPALMNGVAEPPHPAKSKRKIEQPSLRTNTNATPVFKKRQTFLDDAFQRFVQRRVGLGVSSARRSALVFQVLSEPFSERRPRLGRLHSTF